MCERYACRQGWDEAAARLAEQPEEEEAAVALAAVAERAQRLGERFFPNDVAFPGAHVALRLEQTACGLWPERGPAVADADAVPSAMLTVRSRPPFNVSSGVRRYTVGYGTVRVP